MLSVLQQCKVQVIVMEVYGGQLCHRGVSNGEWYVLVSPRTLTLLSSAPPLSIEVHHRRSSHTGWVWLTCYSSHPGWVWLTCNSSHTGWVWLTCNSSHTDWVWLTCNSSHTGWLWLTCPSSHTGWLWSTCPSSHTGWVWLTCNPCQR